jgi:hypothetical protein
VATKETKLTEDQRALVMTIIRRNEGSHTVVHTEGALRITIDNDNALVKRLFSALITYPNIRPEVLKPKYMPIWELSDATIQGPTVKSLVEDVSKPA